MYGESVCSTTGCCCCGGLSPRVRGIQRIALRRHGDRGSIPACTGNPGRHVCRPAPFQVYPRVYGESTKLFTKVHDEEGLSPRVRGIPAGRAIILYACGSIPACTGNPILGAAPERYTQVYPRVYGESNKDFFHRRNSQGLSPRVRGILCPPTTRRRIEGSIPACTGNPGRHGADIPIPGVYPRVYGESERVRYGVSHDVGLSPRVRGIHQAGVYGGIEDGSIPACTGNPRCRAPARVRERVYPRVYGESSICASGAVCMRGLSPRVRGIPAALATPAPRQGSIPACTGNPAGAGPATIDQGVYPRVYGESNTGVSPAASLAGLSPRVRGIPQPAGCRSDLLGSIPACTGNPRQPSRSRRPKRVYPRVYGESPKTLDDGRPGLGLSPRVRGIPTEQRVDGRRAGSIPACTGNPHSFEVKYRICEVYPRVYGESEAVDHILYRIQGLSPRVRGIPHDWVDDDTIHGSIPACTGNPFRTSGREHTKRVYPRVYGESCAWRLRRLGRRGLSPRVRGIHDSRLRLHTSIRSIPACTGNPTGSIRRFSKTRVYPRVYGESIRWYEPG